jgi:hypothetical protein
MDYRYSRLASGRGEARDRAEYVVFFYQLGHHTVIRRRHLAVLVNDVVLAVHDQNRSFALWKCKCCHRRPPDFGVIASRFHEVAQIPNFNPS